MPYLNMDDGFPEHPKVDALTDGAFRLHVAGMHYCARALSDGLIPARKVTRLKPEFDERDLHELIDGGLWHLGGRGCATDTCPLGKEDTFVVHDYLEWNKPKAWWDERREAEKKRKAEWRAGKKKGVR